MLATNSPATDTDSHAVGKEQLADFRTDRRVLILAALAVPIGLISSVLAKILLWLIAGITNLALFHRLSSTAVEAQNHMVGTWIVAVPVVGALIIGLMARYGSEKIRGHGIPEALEAILLGRSLISPKVAILKPVSSAVSIGTGGPFGAEGPIIMTGGAFGSLFAQYFRLSAAERKTLLVAGAAAGMSAVFSSPIAAVLLAVELLLFEWKPRSLIPVAIAALVASLARVPLLGEGPIFGVTAHAPASAAMYGSALLVGVASGLGSGVLTVLVYRVEDVFGELTLHWMWWPALGAIFVGVGGAIDPRVLGVGYGTIHQLMRGELLGMALLTLLFSKSIVWAISLGSGTSGGVLAPLLIIGGALGASLGAILPGGDPGLWAMVGMSAMMGGTMRSPLTGMVFVLELTHDFNALPLLMVGSVTGLCVTVLMMRRSILTEKLARRGQHIAREYSVDLYEMLRVGEAMDRNVPTIPQGTTVGALTEGLARGDARIARRQACVIVDDLDRVAGIITRGDVVRALGTPGGSDTGVSDAGTREVVVTYPDATLYDAVALLLRHDIGRLVVVDRKDPRRPIGYLGRRDILVTRQRHHHEEEHRERGPLSGASKRIRPANPHAPSNGG